MDAAGHVRIKSKQRTKVLLFHEKALANRTIPLSNRTKVQKFVIGSG
jgi:hypothetical protein